MGTNEKEKAEETRNKFRYDSVCLQLYVACLPQTQ